MHKLLLMHEIQSAQYLSCNLANLVFLEWPLLTIISFIYEIKQLSMLYKLTNHVIVLVIMQKLKYLHDIGMWYLSQDL
jgi:hypothetical protein